MVVAWLSSGVDNSGDMWITLPKILAYIPKMVGSQ